MQKFIIDPERETEGCVVVCGQDARHIRRVLRLKPGSPVSMTDGKGMDYTGEILRMDQDRVEISILDKTASETESGLELTICSAMLKDGKMDGVIKMLTQLGIRRWVPFFSSRSVPAPNASRLARRTERWQTISREAIKQCRRSCLVDIHPPVGFEEILEMSQGYSRKIAFWENAGRSLSHLAADSEADAGTIVLIGPEGGFSAEEIQRAQAAGFVSYSLGPRILRAETAAVTATGLIQYILGDMGTDRAPKH
ncbi:MAG: RsmE family RNA methyltransferase [Desulfobacter sp.]